MRCNLPLHLPLLPLPAEQRSGQRRDWALQRASHLLALVDQLEFNERGLHGLDSALGVSCYIPLRGDGANLWRVHPRLLRCGARTSQGAGLLRAAGDRGRSGRLQLKGGLHGCARAGGVVKETRGAD